MSIDSPSIFVSFTLLTEVLVSLSGVTFTLKYNLSPGSNPVVTLSPLLLPLVTSLTSIFGSTDVNAEFNVVALASLLYP